MDDNLTMILNKIKELVPEITINKEPQESLSNILKYEKEYKMNTKDALELYVLVDEEIHSNDAYHYLWDWMNEYHTYQIFDGDESKINSISMRLSIAKGGNRNE